MEQFFIAGSVVALVAAAAFLLIGFAAALKTGKANAVHTYIFFAVSMLLLALYLFLWHFEFRRVGQEIQSTAGSVPVNAGLGQWGQMLGGGIVAALLTLGGREVVTWWRRPRFTISFENKEPFCVPANEPTQSYWLRVKVTNSGKSAAKSCVGRLVQFKDIKKDIIDREPVRLHWVGTPWMPLELLDPIDLSQKDSAFLDVLLTKANSSPREAFLFTNALVAGAQQARGGLVADELAWSRLDKLPLGTCRIRIAIYGDNVEPCSKEYPISWDGENYRDIKLKEK